MTNNASKTVAVSMREVNVLSVSLSEMNAGSCTYPALQILLPPRTVIYNAFALIHLDTMVSASSGLSCGTWRDTGR